MDHDARAGMTAQPWAIALIDIPRREAPQRRTSHRLELAIQAISH